MEVTDTNRLPALDGLRGIAILSVMIYHFSHIQQTSTLSIDRIYNWIAMTGWIGVDIFFALSGFLITGILIDARCQPRTVYFRSFYIRRALRIVPLYYAYLIAYTVALPSIAQHGIVDLDRLEAARAGVIWFWFYGQNIHTFLTNDPGGFAVGHLWSLAIEEQFYLLWPLVVWLTPPPSLLRVALALIVTALAIRIFLALEGFSGYQIYVFSLSRMDALAAGAVAAIVARTPAAHCRALGMARWLVGCAACATVFLLILYGPRADTEMPMYTVTLTVIAAMCGGIVYLASRVEMGSRFRILRSPILVFFGIYSYGLYIFHVPVRAILIHMLGKPWLVLGSNILYQITIIVVCGSISVGIAFTSFKVFELPIMRLRYKHPFRTMLSQNY